MELVLVVSIPSSGKTGRARESVGFRYLERQFEDNVPMVFLDLGIKAR